jgi:hypothetical protein
MWRSAAMLCVGCNQVWNLSPTIQVDAAQFDAPLDAPHACPDIGADPPRFSLLLHQQIDQDCETYAISEAAGRAIGLCMVGGFPVVLEGTVDQPLQPAPGLPASNLFVAYRRPLLAPEGDRAFIEFYDETNGLDELQSYRRTPTGTWIQDAGSVPGSPRVTAPTRGPRPHLLQLASSTLLVELVEDPAGVWSTVASHDLPSLGVTNVNAMWLAPDGTRLVLQVSDQGPSTGHLAYLDRVQLGAPFSRARTMSAPNVPNWFITSDCGRMYIPGLHAVFYADRL